MRAWQEFDGSDSGARPDEAVSWGKIRPSATPVKVRARAALAQAGGREAAACSVQGVATCRPARVQRCTSASCLRAQVCGDATLLLPLLISQTFAKSWEPKPEAEEAQQP